MWCAMMRKNAMCKCTNSASKLKTANLKPVKVVPAKSRIVSTQEYIEKLNRRRASHGLSPIPIRVSTSADPSTL